MTTLHRPWSARTPSRDPATRPTGPMAHRDGYTAIKRKGEPRRRQENPVIVYTLYDNRGCVNDSRMETLTDFLAGETFSHAVAVGGGMLILWGRGRINRFRLKKPVEDGFRKITQVCEPGTLNQEKPSNLTHMRREAANTANILMRPLEKAGFYSPGKCTTDDASLEAWFNFLEDVRMKL